MASVGEIQGAYQNCMSEACRFLNNAGYAVEYTQLRYRPSDKYVTVDFVEPLYFRNWPYRGQSKANERIDILAEIVESIRLADGRCVHTCLRLNYFGCQGDERIASDAIHYDFNESVQARHPVCHAQGVSSILSKRPERFPEKIDVSAIARRHQAIRIPSAFVNFAGLFAKLTADHLPEDAVADFWSACGVYIEKVPDHGTTETSDSIINAKTLRSYSWYKWQ